MSSDIQTRMNGAVEALKKEFNGLRTGRATSELLNPVMVEAYGQKMPLNQVGTVSVADARMITVSVWDKGMLSAVEKGIREAGLGLNPSPDGDMIRVPLPELNEERRQELIKVARKYAEDARVAVRNVRRDGMDIVKKKQADKEISEDGVREETDAVQKMTDETVAKIDAVLVEKEKDILQV